MLPYFSKATFASKVSALLGRTIALEDMVIPDTAQASTGLGTYRDTQLTVNIPAVGGGREDITVYYYKLDLSYLATLKIPVNIPFIEDTTIHYILPEIRQATGINFTTHDLEDLPVVAGESLTAFTLPLQAKLGSLMFKGQWAMPVARKVHAQTLLYNTSLSSL